MKAQVEKYEVIVALRFDEAETKTLYSALRVIMCGHQLSANERDIIKRTRDCMYDIEFVNS